MPIIKIKPNIHSKIVTAPLNTHYTAGWRGEIIEISLTRDSISISI